MSKIKQSRATLQRDEKIQELKKYLADLCEKNEVSTLIIYEENIFDNENCIIAVKKANMELVELFCERLQVPEHMQRDFSLPEYYYRY